MGPEFDDSNDGSGNGPAGQTEDIDNTSYYEEMDYSEPEDMEGGEPDRKNNNNNERTDDRRSVGEWLKEKLTISNIYKAFSFPFVFVAHLIHDIGRAIIFGDSLGSKPINLVNQAEKESKAEDIKKKLNEKSPAEREKEELQDDVPAKEKRDPNKESDEQVQEKEKKESIDSLNSACMRLFGQSPNSFNLSNELGIEMNTDGRSKDGHKILTIGDDKIPVTQQNIRNMEKKVFESVYKNDKYVHSDKQVNVEIESKGSVITTKLSPSEQTQAYISAAVKSCIVGCAFKLSLAEEPNSKSPYCHLYLGRDKDGNTVSMSSVYDKENGTISFRIEEGELSHEVGKIPAESIIHGDQKENLGSYAFGVCEGVYEKCGEKYFHTIDSSAKAMDKKYERKYDNTRSNPVEEVSKENGETKASSYNGEDKKTQAANENTQPPYIPDWLKKPHKREQRTEQKAGKNFHGSSEHIENTSRKPEPESVSKKPEPEPASKKPETEPAPKKTAFELAEIVGKKETAPELIDSIVKENPYAAAIGVCAAKNSNTRSDTLGVLAEKGNDRVKQEVAANKNTEPGVLEKLALCNNSNVQIQVARNPSTPPDVLTLLSNNESQYVRAEVACNKHTPTEVLEHLASVNDGCGGYVRKVAEKTLNDMTIANDQRDADVNLTDFANACNNESSRTEKEGNLEKNNFINEDVLDDLEEDVQQETGDVESAQSNDAQDIDELNEPDEEDLDL